MNLKKKNISIIGLGDSGYWSAKLASLLGANVFVSDSEENINDTIADEFLVSQLQDFYIRDETIFFLDKFVDNLDDFEKVEIVDQFQNHLLKLFLY